MTPQYPGEMLQCLGIVPQRPGGSKDTIVSEDSN